MDDSEKWFAEGVALYEKGDYKRAIGAFDKAIAIDGGKAEVWNNRGLCFIQTGKYRDALQSIDKALTLNPGYKNAREAKRIVLDLLNEPEAPPTSAPAPAGTPVQETAAPSKKPSKMFTIVMVTLFIVAAGGILLVKGIQSGGVALPQIVPTPTTIPVTTVPTTIPTPTPVPTPTPKIIPSPGVWVEVNYSQYFSGWVGIPGNQQPLAGSMQVMPNTGDQFYSIPVNNGFVSASVKKNDGSGNPLTVTFYVDGTLIKTATTTQPFGTLDITAVIPPPTAPLPVNSTETSVLTGEAGTASL